MGIYCCESGAQPDAFSSIPSALWWSVVTLKTVGYGDAYPVTVAGKPFASIVAVLGIAMFALLQASWERASSRRFKKGELHVSLAGARTVGNRLTDISALHCCMMDRRAGNAVIDADSS
jgi:hypothetical protein